MATVLLVRHGRTTANATGVLAGRTPGVELDERGREQVVSAGQRLAGVALSAVVSSPLERCRQTAAALIAERAEQPVALEVQIEDDVTECDYGDWQGRPLGELVKEDLWPVVQSHPSAVTFPGGESMPQMMARSAAAVRRLDAQVEQTHGANAVWAAVSHGDIIKSILADALGMHQDLFQRIGVHPASISVVRYTSSRPQVVAVNTVAGDLSWLTPSASADVPPADAAVGGGDSPSVHA